MKVAIVGSRGYLDLDRVRAYVNNLPGHTIVVSGGAAGVDRAAEFEAEQSGCYGCKVFFADWGQHGKAAGPIRNKQIVDYADRVVAFWDGKSRGTLSTIRLAMAAGKPLEVYGPDGQMMDMNRLVTSRELSPVTKTVPAPSSDEPE